MNNLKLNSRLIAICTIALLGIIIYANSLYSPFQFDDHKFIVKNPVIYNLRHIDYIWKFYPARFIGTLSFALNYCVGQAQPFGYHLVNVVIHIATGLAVFWLLQLTFLTPRMKNESLTKDADIIALGITLLFVAHPLATTVVNHITQRYASLLALFYVTALCCYVKSRLTQNKDYLLGSFVLFVLGMLTKQTAITFPFLILLYEFCFFPKTKEEAGHRTFNWMYIALGLMTLFCCWIWGYQYATLLGGRMASQSHDGETITAINYLLTQPSVIIVYLKLLFFPVSLNFDYDFPVAHSFWQVSTWGSLIVLCILFFWAIFNVRKNVLISFGIFWFFLTLVIESSILPIGYVIAEYRTYLPAVGFCITFSVGLYSLIKNRKVFILTLVCIVGIFSWLTIERNKIWQSELRFWQDALQKSPQKARPHFGIAVAYQKDLKYDQAIKYYQKAIALDPLYENAYLNLSLIYVEEGRFNEALQYAKKAYDLNPTYPKHSHNLGIIYTKLKDFDNGFHYFQNLLDLDFNNDNLVDYTKLIMIFYQTTKDEGKADHYIAYLAKYGLVEEQKYIKEMIHHFDTPIDHETQ